MSKAQITGFMLMGILVLSVMGGVIYMVNQDAQDRIKNTISDLGQGLLQTSAAEYYITECFDTSVKDGLDLIAKQGGMIYADQANGTPEFGIYDYSSIYGDVSGGVYFLPYDTRINYGIFQERTEPDVKFGYYARYRDYTELLEDSTRTFKDVLGNTEGFVPLCDHNGSNAGQNLDCFERFYSTKRQPYSVQSMLESYIENKTQECLNFTLLQEKFGYVIIPNGTPIANVLLGDNDVFVKLDYPLEIKVKGQQSATKLFSFSENFGIRLKKIYEFGNHLATEEMRNIFFDAKTQSDRVRGKDNALSVDFSENPPCDNCSLDFGKYDNIISISDSESKLRGKDYVLRYAVKNRHPYLDWIYTTDPEGTFGRMGFDIFVPEGTPIRIEPNGTDPDGDTITYSYSGWKETEKHTWGPNDPAWSSGVDCQFDIWGCTLVNYFDVGEIMVPGDYNPSNGKIKIDTTEEDVGAHNLTLTINDSEGLTDWQIISILVWPLPVLEIVTRNTYLDIDNTHASIEDPYILDATGSSLSFIMPGDQLIWEVINADSSVVIAFIVGELTEEIPKPTNIDTIVSVVNHFKRTTQSLSVHSVTHKIKFTYAGGPVTVSPVSIDDVEVYACLPHVSSEPAYPYGPDFTGNHTCCNSDPLSNYGTIKAASTNTVCYKKEELVINPYIEFGSSAQDISPADKAMVADSNTGSLSDYDHIGPVSNVNLHDRDYANDIFTRVYTVECDGIRGNACTGTPEDRYAVKYYCDDDWYSGQDERCSGPKSISEPICYNYMPGKTFESVILGTGSITRGSIAFCDDTPQRAKYVGGKYIPASSDATVECGVLCFEGKCNYFHESNCECIVNPAYCDRPNSLIKSIWPAGICDANCNPLFANGDPDVCSNYLLGYTRYESGICCGGYTNVVCPT